jgi:nitrogen-specific signal transduction histidine kinase
VELRAQRVAQPSGAETVLVTVADNGPGIPIEFRDKVFSPFCTSKPRGMGLGLPIAKRTVIDHNGSIDIDTAPEGTQVVISLPSGKLGTTL